MTYNDHFSAHLRIALLRQLLDAPEYRANSSILHSIMPKLGLSATRDQIKTELAWLREQSLVAIDDLDGLLVVTATERGIDVAEGRAVVPGVQRPTPRR
jgi:hypothetical protein